MFLSSQESYNNEVNGQYFGDFIVKFEQISHIVFDCLLLALCLFLSFSLNLS